MRLYEFESPLALFEDISGEEMLQVFHTMHHDAGMNPDMDQYIMNHNWELRDFTPDMFPTEEEFFDYDDPFDRIVDIDYGHRVNIADPIIVGPSTVTANTVLLMAIIEQLQHSVWAKPSKVIFQWKK